MTHSKPQAGTASEARAFAVLARLFAGPATKDELIAAARAIPGAGRAVNERTIRRYLSAARSAGFEVEKASLGKSYVLVRVPGRS